VFFEMYLSHYVSISTMPGGIRTERRDIVSSKQYDHYTIFVEGTLSPFAVAVEFTDGVRQMDTTLSPRIKT